MALTRKQERRVYRCLEAMRVNAPRNPMDISGVTKAAKQNREAAKDLGWALFDATEGAKAAEVNASLWAAETTLDLMPVEEEPQGE